MKGLVTLKVSLVGGLCVGVILTLLLVPARGEDSGDKTKCMEVKSFVAQGIKTWNTSNTLWKKKSKEYMELYLRYKQKSAAVTSPSLCTFENETYSLSFTYAVSGGSFTSCYLTLNVETGGILKRLWRSTGGTLNMFSGISPPIRFSTCSSQIKLVFEGTRVNTGRCGFSESVSFKDIKLELLATPLTKDERQAFNCRDPVPNAKPHPWKVKLILIVVVSLGVVVIIVAVIIVAVMSRRFRKALSKAKEDIQGALNKGFSYKTFPEGDVQYRSPDYDTVDDEDDTMTTTAAGDHDGYNRLGDKVGPAQQAQHGPQTHYNHINDMDGDADIYCNIRYDRTSHQQQRGRATDYYNHV